MKTILSVIGGLLITLAIGLGINETAKTEAHDRISENVITTSGGILVKLGKVKAELAQTAIQVGSAGSIITGLTEAPAKIDQLFREAGGDTTTMLSGNMTICLTSVVAYNSELNGVVSATIAKECRNFTEGQMVGTILTFAEDYTVHVKTLYETKYTFINKGSK